MAQLDLAAKPISFGETQRRDRWWLQPVLVSLGFLAFIVYSTWAALQNGHYHHGSLLSPFYSPLLFGDPEHSWFGATVPILPWLSPAFLILWMPGGFRFTCYYYRGAYYKAVWQDPPNCAVGEPRKGYWGEHALPLVIQNIHRYFLYLALLVWLVLLYDVWKAMWWENHATGTFSFGISLGTLVLAVNVFLLGAYTLGCHSLRHLAGGGWNRLSTRPLRRQCYAGVSCLNRRHMMWAWISLFWVGFSDIYVRLCSMGVWSDLRFF
jgi:hypothetical protein